MTAAPAPTRPSTRWLPLDDHPAALCPLELGIVRLILQGQARTLLQALNLSDPDGLSTRLLSQQGGRLYLHAAHLDALTAPLNRDQAVAFQLALGVTVELEEPAVPAPRPRLDLLHQAALGSRSSSGSTVRGAAEVGAAVSPATQLSRAIQRLNHDPDTLTTYNAVLATEALRAVSWHWLEQRNVLHLELLSGLNATGGSGAHSADAALQQLMTTLTGARRGAARSLVEAARAQHAALYAHQAAQRQARRDLIRAAVRAAALLTEAGWLIRPADARWLTPTELRDALDGTLDPATLRGLTQLRRLQHSPAPQVPTWTLVDRHYPVVPLSPGVRDGLLYQWIPGQPVPEGRIALCADVRPWQWPQLAGAAAVILDRAGPLSPAALHERSVGRPAVGLRGRRPEWMQPDAFVRMNAHQGAVTLLRRADVPGLPADLPNVPVPALPAPEEEALLAGTPPIPSTHGSREVTSLRLDFDLT
ncbi:hypothetical protein E7T09_06135 [Deinococcus sp. KSM4-11]|uniref:hypothetical protein n=1 Tax=Deinococcus sp. KSM4-11 TaxID=2568654 RepID=UPI0010A47D92|nr:hypothetical protein [Deinococcus sp. KSM4-11]THF88753.1 hypothetical protein E7T09_06135 [Deinococcus sp. KSM4-11]